MAAGPFFLVVVDEALRLLYKEGLGVRFQDIMNSGCVHVVAFGIAKHHKDQPHADSL
jgi:hypothetical protein